MTQPFVRKSSHIGSVGNRVGVMQPYFFPYGGYFRLFATVDQFVAFDCVQFPRRGRVHRCELPERDGAPQWLTLPLRHQPRSTRICDLEFADDARAEFDRRLESMHRVLAATGPHADRIRTFLHGPLSSPVDYLVAGLQLVCDLLDLRVPIVRSSTLDLPRGLRGQERVIAAARAVGASHYINASGGRGLYDNDAFAREGLTLSFLHEYDGAYRYLLPALMALDSQVIRADVVATARLSA